MGSGQDRVFLLTASVFCTCCDLSSVARNPFTSIENGLADGLMSAGRTDKALSHDQVSCETGLLEPLLLLRHRTDSA